MNARKKVWSIVGILVLASVTLACACGPLSSMFGTPTPVPPPTTAAEPMRGLAGAWLDTQEGTLHTIVWTGTTYHVVSSVDDNLGNCPISSENWNGSTFTWTYEVTQNNVSVTIEATSVSGNSLNVNWTSTNGNSGTDVFTRQ